ncbi:hypothetical protein [Saccharibacillus sacchari]|uniref:Uncharacterized protein n=1 Tax=Saccharibacillus sacchari TaxID=456493 RepID=A0ACC6PCX7_9BACL
METSELKSFLLTHQSFEVAKKTFKIYVQSWKEEEPEEFFEAFENIDIDLLEVEKWRGSLVLNFLHESDIEYVSTSLRISFNDKTLAEYFLIQDLDGEIIDDRLHFE